MKTIAILGCGTITAQGHLPGLMQTPDLSVATVFDRNIQKARDLQRTFGLAHVSETEDEFWATPCAPW